MQGGRKENPRRDAHFGGMICGAAVRVLAFRTRSDIILTDVTPACHSTLYVRRAGKTARCDLLFFPKLVSIIQRLTFLTGKVSRTL